MDPVSVQYFLVQGEGDLLLISLLLISLFYVVKLDGSSAFPVFKRDGAVAFSFGATAFL